MQVMTEKGQKTDIGLIGLAVMGENLALNMADKGWHVSVFNRTVPGWKWILQSQEFQYILQYFSLWHDR